MQFLRLSIIICLGVALMAGPPTSSPSPGRVTVPTPGPPWKTNSHVSGVCTGALLACFASARFRVKVVTIGSPLVTSGSSPPSLMTVALTSIFSSENVPDTDWQGISIVSPLGRTVWIFRLKSSSMGFFSFRKAAMAAAAAQLPVVSQLRNGK